MNYKILILLSLLNFISYSSLSQNVYPNKFGECDTKMFGLENDSITAKVNNEILIDVLTKGLDEKTLKNVSGILKIQIIAYTDNSSCMISYENATNLTDEELQIKTIKKTIDEELVWEEVPEAVSPMIEFFFLIDTINIKRIGFGGNKGFHELID